MSCTSLPWTLFSAYLVVELFTRGAVVRFVAREIARVFVLMELGAIQLVRAVVRPRHLLTGECHKCGECCRQLLADPPAFVKRPGRAHDLFLAYHRLAHNFHPVGRGPEDEIIFACGHLRPDGRCGIYRHRPFLCRNYPVVPFYHPPLPLPACGFGVAPRVVAAMRNRQTLPIVNPDVVVHHPTPIDRGEPVLEHFQLVDPSCSDHRVDADSPERGRPP